MRSRAPPSASEDPRPANTIEPVIAASVVATISNPPKRACFLGEPRLCGSAQQCRVPAAACPYRPLLPCMRRFGLEQFTAIRTKPHGWRRVGGEDAAMGGTLPIPFFAMLNQSRMAGWPA